MIGPFFRHPKNFGVVEAGKLYRSGRLTPRSLAFIARRYHIKTIIDLGATTLDPKREAAIRRAAESLGITRYALRLKGTGKGDPNEYVRALRIMTREDLLPVHIHCAAGAQRTGACIALYRHIIQRKPLETALQEAAAFGQDPEKDARLHAYLEQWRDHIAQSSRTGAPIPYDGPTARQDNRTPIEELPQ